MIVDQLFNKNNKLNEGLADEIMATAKSLGMNPRLRGTPDQERERTKQMLKQRAADRARAPAPEPVSDEERARLHARLKELEARFDPNFEYSDDHSFWTKQRDIAQEIGTIKQVLRRGMTESRKRKLNEALLMEDPVYGKFKRIGQYIVERRMSEKEILQAFADAETGMTDKATGANRTFLGRGKDTAMDFAGGVADALKGVWSGIQNSVPVAAVDVAYDQATDALANLTGGQKGTVMQAIKKYRNLAKQYPKTAGLSKAALVAITGLATGGAGLPAVAALVYGLDSAIKGEKLSDIALKAGGAAATAWAGQKIASAFGGDAAAGADSGAGGLDPSQFPAYDDAGNLMPGWQINPESGQPYWTGELTSPSGFAGATDAVGGGTYTIQSGDQLGYIAQANGSTVEQIRQANPGIDFSKPLKPGMEIQLPSAGTPGQGSVWQGYQGGMYGDKPTGPELLGGPGASGPAAGGGSTGGAAATPAGPASTGDNVFSQAAFDREFAALDAEMGGAQATGAEQTGAGSAAKPNYTPMAVDAPSDPLIFDPATGRGTVTLPDGETLRARVFPADGIQPRLGSGLETVKIIHNGQEITGYIKGNEVWFTNYSPAPTPTGANAALDAGMSGATATGAEQAAAPIDYTKPGPISTDSMGHKTEYGIRVSDDGKNFYKPDPGLPAEELARQQAAYDAWKQNYLKRFPEATFRPDGSVAGAFKPGLAPMFPGMGQLPPGLTPKAMESRIRFKKLTAEQLIDQKGTMLTWALNESVGRRSNSLALTPLGVSVVFENVERWRRAIMELKGVPGSTRPQYYRPDMPDAPAPTKAPKNQSWFGKGLDYLDRGVKKVGGALSNFGHQFTTNVTKEKLKMNWHQAGKPSDSDQLAAFMIKQGVPQEVVTSVFGKMGIPYTPPAVTAPAPEPSTAGAKTDTAGTAKKEMPWLGINPATKKPYTYDDIAAKTTAGAGTPGGTTPPADATADTDADAAGAASGGAGAGVFGNMAAQLAARPTRSSTGGTTTGVSGVGSGVVRHRASATNPNQPKPAAVPASTATLPAGGGAGVTAANPFGSMASTLAGGKKKKAAPVAETAKVKRIVDVLKKPISEMLLMVETKEDVNSIKKFIDQTFIKYGAVNESAFAVRNKMIEHVTQVGAQRRREFARQS